VEKVLNDYVANVVVPRVQGLLSTFTYQPYAWPTFDALNPPPLVESPSTD
jgi:hypothetical protein